MRGLWTQTLSSIGFFISYFCIVYGVYYVIIQKKINRKIGSEYTGYWGKHLLSSWRDLMINRVYHHPLKSFQVAKISKHHKTCIVLTFPSNETYENSKFVVRVFTICELSHWLSDETSSIIRQWLSFKRRMIFKIMGLCIKLTMCNTGYEETKAVTTDRDPHPLRQLNLREL